MTVSESLYDGVCGVSTSDFFVGTVSSLVISGALPTCKGVGVDDTVEIELFAARSGIFKLPNGLPCTISLVFCSNGYGFGVFIAAGEGVYF